MFSPASVRDLVHFAKNLSLMLKSGMTINEALAELAAEAGARRFARVLASVEKDVEAGIPLAVALGKHPRVFGPVILSAVQAGETSGTLEENLNFLADWLEHNADIRREVHGAMLYPAIVFIATIGVSAGLSLLVLPRLLPVFAQLSVDLPASTRFLLWFTETLRSSWLLMLLGVALLAVVVVLLNRLYAVRRVLHACYLHVPFIGTLLKQYQLTLLGQLFTTLSASGLSIYEVIAIAANGATNLLYRDALMTASAQIAKGTTLAEALARSPKLFPREFTSILAVGEKSGTLDESFRYLTEYYRKEVFTATKRLPTIIEPILLLVMGALVAFIALSIILPIYEFTSNVRR